MDTKLIIAGLVGAVAVTAVGAAAGYRYMDPAGAYATVIAVKPAVTTINVPREECRDEMVTLTRPTEDPNQIAGTVAGGVIGGVIGSQIGDGSGKKVAIVGGAVAGGIAGNKIQEGMQERNVYQEIQRVCVTVNEQQQSPAGYDVTYELDGRQHTVRTDYDPGRRIAVVDGAVVRSR